LLDGIEGGGPDEWSQITLEHHSSVGVTTKGELFTWGRGDGSLGHGHNNDIMTPAHVKSLVGKPVTDLFCSVHTAVATTEGELFTS
jgi:alpha-tubulin suppressor-like RCC1 family protein